MASIYHFTILVSFLMLSTLPNPSIATSRMLALGGGPSTLVLGNQILDEKYYLGKSLTNRQITHLALKAGHNKGNAISLVFTAADVAVAEFCMSECGTHGYARYKKVKYAYAWVGNPGDPMPRAVRVAISPTDIWAANPSAGAVTNPFDDGYYEGPEGGSLEAVSACTGIFGKGAYPGYPGEVLVDKPTGASYNAVGVNGRKYLLPAMWDPRTSVCKTFV
uniref:Uncharacterized protein n=1 Tax=Fagus sylvatica TaxID=28930 RepID=A0A2N9FAA1_FAGSY